MPGPCSGIWELNGTFAINESKFVGAAEIQVQLVLLVESGTYHAHTGKGFHFRGGKEHFGVHAVNFLQRMTLNAHFVMHDFIYFKKGLHY